MREKLVITFQGASGDARKLAGVLWRECLIERECRVSDSDGVAKLRATATNGRVPVVDSAKAFLAANHLGAPTVALDMGS